MIYRIEGFQFTSRKTLEPGSLGNFQASPPQRHDIGYDLEVSIECAPFKLGFAELIPRSPSVGAFEYINPDVQAYMVRRWPYCLSLRGTVSVPEKDLSDKLRAHILDFMREKLWAPHEEWSLTPLPNDQRATQPGYRRMYFHGQLFDAAGERVPHSSASFVATQNGEPVGPGLSSSPDLSDPLAGINEMVWSEVLPFPHRTSLNKDRPQIDRRIDSKRKHYNSNSEYEDARRHKANGEVKAAVRSAASAVDAILRYYQKVWGVPPPSPHQPFDEKIEEILAAAGKPSYRSLDPAASQNLLHLYRCRNSMHDGDCCYKASDSTRIDVNRVEQVVPWLEAVEAFIAWIDSLV